VRRRLRHRRQPFRRDLERRHDLVRPAALLDVEEQGPGRVRGVDAVLAGQAEEHVVLRQQDAARRGEDLRLVPAEPEELRCGEARQRPVAGQLDEPLEADAPLDLGALLARALVVPEDRRSQYPVVLVEADEPMHLARKTEADLVEGQPRQDGLGRPPPVLRILLRPAGMRHRERV
jgi:hypothetical protein